MKIYVLLDCIGKIRYVGKTSMPLQRRLLYHLAEAKSGEKTHKCKWIRSLLEKGTLPDIRLIEEHKGNGNKEEIGWIAFFRALGINLANGTDGGDNPPSAKGRHLSEEHRKKIGNARRGKTASIETRRRISECHRGKPSWNKGKPRSAATKRKLRKACKGRPSPMEGKHHSLETKAKLSKSLILYHAKKKEGN